MPVTATRSRPALGSAVGEDLRGVAAVAVDEVLEPGLGDAPRRVGSRSAAPRTSAGRPSASRKRATASAAARGRGRAPRRAERSSGHPAPGTSRTSPGSRRAAPRTRPGRLRLERLPDPARDVLGGRVLEDVVQVAVVDAREHLLLHRRA